MVAYGWCRGIEDAQQLHAYGLDYIECPLSALQLENETQHQKLLPAYLESPLPVYAFNVFFPGDLKVVGPDADPERIRRYLHRAAKTMNRIGAKIAVLGSGRARAIPEGWEWNRAEDQLLLVLSWISEEFTGSGVTLAIEPLNKKETNLIGSVAEAVRFAKQINHSTIRVLADFYHMDEEGEALNTLTAHKDWLAHIHIADTGRLSPGTGQYPYAEFAAQLQAAGYKGGISAECTADDPGAQIPAGFAFMRQAFRQLG
ncbi:sugar phosphate isomerase/epimerase family protein [Paenibacillus montanisoli]|uniref:Sugar phosphate isomerase/epimerase n=1 Tax=Paenibacillus montanisoli TaxID=2081970 RepID=A0A328U3X5_9BACL|nr:sugar phosphate isomerase/epimerase family protein [Paenibacillus montanisoli]RAP77527.1 sugar phosphate isomerase/epimerase [Paenibacillus montanisoli]